jgi:hypothetical protein
MVKVNPGFSEKFAEEFTTTSDEWSALLYFTFPGSFTDYHEFGVSRTVRSDLAIMFREWH